MGGCVGRLVMGGWFVGWLVLVGMGEWVDVSVGGWVVGLVGWDG